jgi:hypothetical protein
MCSSICGQQELFAPKMVYFAAAREQWRAQIMTEARELCGKFPTDPVCGPQQH